MSAAAPLGARDTAFRLSMLYVAMFLVAGVQAPFLPVWLRYRNLTVGEIGLILAAPRLLQVLVLPLLTRWADRRGEIVRMLLVSAIMMALIYSALIVANSLIAILALIGLLFLAQTGAMPLIDVLTFAIYRPFDRRRSAPDDIGGVAPAPFDYGRIRKWGSAAFVAGNLLAGAALSLTSVSAINVVLAWSAIFAAFISVYAAPLDALAQPLPKPAPEFHGAPRPKLLMMVIGGAACIQASHVLVQSFGAIHWSHEGHSDLFIGTAWAAGVVAETTFFALIGRMKNASDRAPSLMVLGAAVALARWLVMTFNPGSVVLLLAQSAHGLSYAATHVGTMLLISQLAPPHMGGGAQGRMVAANAGLSAVLVALCGPLYGGMKEYAYLVMAAFALIGLVMTILVRARRGA